VKHSSPAAARRYARALLDVAAAKGQAERLRLELRELADLLSVEPQLSRALLHPGLGVERRQRLVRALFAERGSELLNRLLDLLAERDRLALLPELADAYARAYNEHAGVLTAEALSALPLDEAQTGTLRAALKSATGREVELRARVDPALLGGVVVTLAGRTYDGSVRAQLQQLRARLVRGAGA
jgi:F-type H+-transporting ATPase subunit delta